MANPNSTTLVFIDANVANAQTLAQNAKPGTEVIILEPRIDGVEQISKALEGRINLASIQIIAHGREGEILLGSTLLNRETLQGYQDQLQRWGKALSENGDILLFGCNVATGEGIEFVQELSQITGADVAASDDLTGSATLGGDWELEVQIGEIEVEQGLQETVTADHKSVLAIYEVTNTNNSDTGSLRWAIDQAKNTSEADVIDLRGISGGIFLNSSLPTIDRGGEVFFIGNNKIKIDGQDQRQIIAINGGSNVPLVGFQGIEFEDGYATGGDAYNGGGGGLGAGGAIFINSGSVVVDNVTFDSNKAEGGDAYGNAQGGADEQDGETGGRGGSLNATGIFSLSGGDGGLGGKEDGDGGDIKGGDGRNGSFGAGGGAGGGGGGGDNEGHGGRGGQGGFGAGGGGGGGGGSDDDNFGDGNPGSGGLGGSRGAFGGRSGNGASGIDGTNYSANGGRGGGGAGLGGAIFARQDATLTVQNSSFTDNSVVVGLGSENGQAKGEAIAKQYNDSNLSERSDGSLDVHSFGNNTLSSNDNFPTISITQGVASEISGQASFTLNATNYSESIDVYYFVDDTKGAEKETDFEGPLVNKVRLNGNQQTVTIPNFSIINDEIHDGQLESLTIQLLPGTNYKTSPDRDSKEIEIQDDEPLLKLKKLADKTEGEDVRVVNAFEIGLFKFDGTTPQPSLRTVDLKLEISGDAVRGSFANTQAGSDYKLFYTAYDQDDQEVQSRLALPDPQSNQSTYTITIPKGATYIQLQVEDINDELFEQTENIQVTFHDGEYGISGDRSATINLIDNEPTVSLGEIVNPTEGMGFGSTIAGLEDAVILRNQEFVPVEANASLNLASAGKFTQEAWIFPEFTDNRRHGILGYLTGNNQAYPSISIFDQTSIEIGFGDGTNWNSKTVENVINPNTWNHIATTFDGKDYKLFVNAVEVFSTSEFADQSLAPTQQLEIGKAGDSYFEGAIDEVRIWNVARSAGEIQQFMISQLEGSEEGLVGYWNFNGNSDNQAIENSQPSQSTGQYINNPAPQIGYIEVNLDEPFQGPQGLWVKYELTGGSATQNVDYFNSRYRKVSTDAGSERNGIIIPEGETTARIYFSALSDALVEEDETLNINLISHNFDTDTRGITYSFHQGNGFDSVDDLGDNNLVSQGLWSGALNTEIGRQLDEDDDNYGIIYKGWLRVPESGQYTFYTTSDDGSTLSINEKEVVSNDGLHGEKTESGTIDLEAGIHPITVKFFEGGGGDRLTVEWEEPNLSRQEISPSALIQSNYGINPDSASATVTIKDNQAYQNSIVLLDEKGQVVSPENPLVIRDKQAQFSIQLSSQPTNDVTVTLASNQGDLNNISRTFTPDNWDVSQPIALNGVETSGQITASANGYLSGSLTFNFTNDPPLRVTEGSTTDAIPVTPNVKISSQGDITEDGGESGNFILQLSAPAPTDGVTINYTVSGNTTSNTDYQQISDAVLNFDGQDDYVEVANQTSLNITSAITLEARVYLDEESPSGNRRILQKGNNDDQYRLLIENNQLKFDLGNVGSVAAPLFSGKEWHHLAGVYDGSNLILYVDGVQVGSASASGAINTTSDSLNIGTKNASAPAGDRWKGRLDEIRIWNVARTQAEIVANQEQNLSGTETGLVAYYQGTVTTDNFFNLLIDSSSANNDGELKNGANVINLGSVTIPEGETRGIIPILPIADETNETDETVAVTLTTGQGYTVSTEDSQATLTILNDDNPGIKVVNAQAITDENGNATVSYSNNLVPVITHEPYPNVGNVVELRDSQGKLLGKVTLSEVDLTAGKITIIPTEGSLDGTDATSLRANLKETAAVNLGFSINNSKITINNGVAEINLPSIGSQASVGIRLQTQPTAEVTIALKNIDGTETSLDKTTLTFTPDNWDTYQPVTLTGLDDVAVDGDISYKLLAEVTASNDSNYKGKTFLIDVQNLDDDQQLDSQEIGTKETNPNLPVVSIGNGTTVAEDGATAEIHVTLSAPATQETNVIFDITDGTATINEDYQVLQQALVEQFEPDGRERFASPFDGINNLGETPKLTFADLDNDSDLDAIIGTQNGISYYENVGSTSLPTLEARTGINNPFGNITLSGAAPSFGDLNGDGTLDLLVGTQTGNFVYYVNTGNLDNPRFHRPDELNPVRNDPFSGINVSNHASPFLVDFDGDGDLDLITGSQGSSDDLNTLRYFQNVGSKVNPVFTEQSESPITKINAGQNSSPFVVDWDQDGDLDILVGQEDGSVRLWENQDGNFSQQSLTQSNNALTSSTFASPAFADLDQDGDLDAYVGNADGTVAYYEQFNLVKFAAGEQTKTINLKINDDQVAEANETLDLSLFSNAGYQLGSPEVTLKFDGQDDYVEVGNQSQLNITNALTLEARVYLDEDSPSGNRRILQKGNNDDQYRLLIENNELKFDVANVGSVTAPLFSGKEWHHLAGVYDGSKLILYIDGTEAGSASASGLINTTPDSLNIGTKNASAPAGDRWKGQLDEIRIWNVARTQAEIVANQAQKLSGRETELVAYYQGNTNSNNAVSDSSIYNNNGELRNGATSGNEFTATVVITDNDTSGITITSDSETNLTSEAGNSLSYRVKLNSQPTAPVILYLGTQDETEALVSTESDLSSLSKVVSLEFTPENWDTEQTFFVKGIDDDVDDGDLSYNIIPTVFSEDQQYHRLAVNPVSLTNTDDDQVGFLITGAGKAVEGRENVYSVRLDSQPVGEVRLIATPTNDQIRLNNELVGEPSTLTFTPDNWDFDQTVRATALDDSVVEYLHTSEITFEVETGEGLNFESKADNSLPENALDLGTIEGGYTWNNLAISSETDVDWFKFTLPDTGNAQDFAQINFDQADGNLKLALYRADDLETALQTVDSSNNSQDFLQISLNGQSFGEYYLKVSGSPNNYDLVVADEDYQYKTIIPKPLPVVIEDNDLPTARLIAGPTASEVFGQPSYFTFQLNAPAPANDNGIKVNYRLVGGSATFHEDTNGNGQLDSGEDRNGNGTLDLGDYRMQTEGSVRIAPGDIQNNLVVVPIDDKLVEDLNLKVTNTQPGTKEGELELTVTTPSPKKEALGFDGQNDYVKVNNSSSLNITSDLTVEAQIYLDEENFAGNRRILQKGGDRVSNGEQVSDQYRLLVEFGTFKFDVGGVGVVKAPITELPGREWHHVAGVYDASAGELAIYVNGEKVTSKRASGNIKTTNEPLFIGTKPSSDVSGDFWKGQLDDIRIWNVARTPEEIKANQNRTLSGNETGLAAYYPVNSSEQLIDRSGNNNNGELVNGASYVTLETAPDTFPLPESTEIKFADNLVATVKNTSDLLEQSGFYQGKVTVEVDASRQGEITDSSEGKVALETVIVELLPGEGYLLPENPQGTLSIYDDDVPGIRIVQVGDNTVVREGETASFQVSLLSEPTDNVTIRLTPGAEFDFVNPVNPTTVQVDKEVYTFDESSTGNLDVKINSLVTTEKDKTVAFDIKLQEKPSTDVIVELYDANDSNGIAKTLTFTAVENNPILGEQEGNWNQAQQVIIGNLDPNRNGDFALKAVIKDAETGAPIGSTIDLPINRTTVQVEKQTTELTISPEKWFELQTVTVTGIDEGVAEPGLYHQSDITYEITSRDANYNNVFVPQQRIDIADRLLNPESTSQAVQEGLTNLQKSLNEVEIPIVGSLDGKTPSLISDISDKLVAAIGGQQNLSANRLKTLIEETLSTLGLDFLDVSVAMSEDDLSIVLNVGQTYDLFSLPLDVDLGLDALGIGLKTEGDLKSSFEFEVGLGLGLHKDFGFYLDTEQTKVEAALRLNLDDFKGQGNLAFLRLDMVDDPENPTELAITFEAGLNDLDNYQTVQFFDVDGDHQLDAETFRYPIKNPNKTPDPEVRQVQEPFTAVNSKGQAESFPTVPDAEDPAKRVNWNGNNSFDAPVTRKNEGVYRTKKDASGNIERYYFDFNRNGKLDEKNQESLFSVTPGTTKWFDKQGKVKPFRIEERKVNGVLTYYFDQNGNNSLDSGESLTKKEKAKLDKNNNGKLDADVATEGEGVFVQGTGIAFRDTNGNGKLDGGEPYVNSGFGDLKLSNSNLSLSFLDLNGDGEQASSSSIGTIQDREISLSSNLSEPLLLEGTDEKTQESFVYLDLNGDQEFSEDYKDSVDEPKLVEDSNLGFSFLDLNGNETQESNQEPSVIEAGNDNAFLDLNGNGDRDSLIKPIINQDGTYLSFLDQNNDGKQQKLLDYNRDGAKNDADYITEASVETGTYPNGRSFQYLDTSGDGYWTREHQIITDEGKQYLDLNDNKSKDSDDLQIIVETDISNIKQDQEKTLIYRDGNGNKVFNNGEKLLLDSFTGRFIQDINSNDEIDENEPIVNVRLVDSQLVLTTIKSTTVTVSNSERDPVLASLDNQTISYLDESQDDKFTREYQVLADNDNNDLFGQVLDTNNDGQVNFSSSNSNSNDPLVVFSDALVLEETSFSFDSFLTSFKYLDFNNNGEFDESNSDRFPREYKVIEATKEEYRIDRNHNGQADTDEPIANLVEVLDLDDNRQFTDGRDLPVGQKFYDQNNNKEQDSDEPTFKFFDQNRNGIQESNEPFIFDSVTFLDLNKDDQLTLNEENTPDDLIVNEDYLDLNGNEINNAGEPQLDEEEWVINEDNVITYKIIHPKNESKGTDTSTETDTSGETTTSTETFAYIDQHQEQKVGSKQRSYEQDIDINLTESVTLTEFRAKALGLSGAGTYTAAELLGLTVANDQVIESEVTFVDLEGDGNLDLTIDPVVRIEKGIRFVDLDNNGRLTVDDKENPIEPVSYPNNEFDTEGLTGTGKIITFLDDGDRLTLTELKNWKNDSDLGFFDLFGYQFAGTANLGLKTKTSIKGDPAFPSVAFDLAVGLPLFNYGNQEEAGSNGLSVEFNEINLDFGTFLTDVAAPVVKTVDEIIEPVKPILEVLNKDTKIFSYIGLEDSFNRDSRPGVSILDIAIVLAEVIPEDTTNRNLKRIKDSVPKAVKFINTVTQIVELNESLKKLTESGETIVLELGSYNLDDLKAASDDPADTTSKINPEQQGTQTPSPQGNPNEQAQQSASPQQKSTLEKLQNLEGLEVPILSNPLTLIRLLLGESNVDLIKYDIPDLEFFVGKEQEFFLWTPPTIEGSLELGFEAKTDLSVGYDTGGLEAWRDSDFALSDIYKILDGFYVDDWDENGEEKDELSASARIAAGLSASVVIAKAVLKGGVDGYLGFDLVDEGELQGKSDGKVRGSEIISRLDTPLELFDLKGSLDAFLSGEIRVGLDVGLFEIMKTVWSEELARTTIAEFNVGASGITFSSSISNSYINTATVFFDANFNNQWDEGEPITFTNEYGQYNLDIGLEWDANGDGEINELDGQVIAVGGYDTSSGSPAGKFVGLPGSTIITPLTSLQVPLVQNGLTPEAADTLIKEQLSLDPNFDLESFDSLNAVGQQEELGLDIYLAHIQVQAIFNHGKAFLDGLQGQDADPNNQQFVQVAFAEFLQNRAEFRTDPYEVSNTTAIKAFLSFLVEQNAVTPTAQQLETTAQILATSNEFLNQVAEVGASKSLAEALPVLAAVKRLVQGELTQLTQELAADSKPVETVLAEFEKLLYQNYTLVDADINAFGNRSVKVTSTTTNLNEVEQGQSEFVIELSHPAPNQGLSIFYTLSGTATLNEDYQVSASKVGELYIEPGSSSGIIEITVLNDEIAETVEAITLNLQSVGEGYLIDPTGEVALIDLADDDNLETATTNGEVKEGGLGSDTLVGTTGNDLLEGNYGNDNLSGGEGDDLLRGGHGKDILEGGVGNDQLEGNFGDDALDGGAGNDIIEGNSGRDVLTGGIGVDILAGGTGDDILEGNAGNDQLKGEEGNDLLLGNEDNDWLSGGIGNDILIGGTGDDILNGGKDADVFFFNSTNEGFDTILDFNLAQGDKIQVSATGFDISTLENFRFINGVLDFNGENLALVQNNGATYAYFPNLADIIEIVEEPTAIPGTNGISSTDTSLATPENNIGAAQVANNALATLSVENSELTILDDIIERGYIKVGASSLASEFDFEFARTLAAALFGDATQVEIVTAEFPRSFELVADGIVDVTSQRATHTLGRDTTLNVDFSPLYFYDHQAVIVRNDSGIETALDLEDRTIGILEGTTSLRNLQNELTPQGVEFNHQSFATIEEMVEAYDQGKIDAYSIDRALILDHLNDLSNPENHRLLDVEFSKEPIALVLPENDSQWADVVRWVNYVPIQAEEFGISSENIDGILAANTDADPNNDSSPAIRRFLGVEGELGATLGLPNDFAVTVIQAVGNYGEIYDRHFPNLERDRNLLWTDGGLLYSLPFSGSTIEGINLENNDGRNLLQDIQQRGRLKVGLDKMPGFAVKQADGSFTGFDTDLARALAAAVFGDSNQVQFVEQLFKDGFANAANGVVDISAMAATHNLVRDAALGIDYSPTYIYTGQGILVKENSGINVLATLNGRRVGFEEGTTALQNLQDALVEFGGTLIPVIFPTSEEMFAAYENGEVDAVSTDLTILTSYLANAEASNPESHRILNDVLSKEPLALVIDENQSEWADVVRSVTNALVQAEEYGITADNIDALIAINTDNNPDNDSNPAIRQFLGLEGKLGEALGLSNDFAVNAIKAVGNYGEIYERHFDSQVLRRDQNELSNDFGLQYALPMGTASATIEEPQPESRLLFGSPEPDVMQEDLPELVFSGAGEDLLDISISTDSHRLYSGSDNDELFAGTNSRLFGGTGADILDATAGEGDNRLYGGEGDDELKAGNRDRLFGGVGNDTLDGTGGSDNRFYGGEGDDTLVGGLRDRLIGQEGNDILVAGSNNVLTGGAGEDQFWIVQAELPSVSSLITDFKVGADVIGIEGLILNNQPVEFSDLSFTEETQGTAVRINEVSPEPLAIVASVTPELLNASANFNFG